ncbi:unnamed protein product, partial [marine sediment metagenome]
LASAHLYLGLTLEFGDNCMSARSNFEKARALFEEISLPGYMLDAMSGLARCSLALKEYRAAQQWAEPVWERLSNTGSQGLEFPGLAYLACIEVFEGLGKTERTDEAIVGGYYDLTERSERIGDPSWRLSFLQNIPEHQAIWKRFRPLSRDIQKPDSS